MASHVLQVGLGEVVLRKKALHLALHRERCLELGRAFHPGLHPALHQAGHQESDRALRLELH